MKATSKREAQRNASPLVTKKYFEQSTESAKYDVNYSALSELHGHLRCLPGATRLTLFGACPWLSYSAPLALVPDFHISRLWRWCLTFIFRAVGGGARLSYSAPLALVPDFHIPRLWRWCLAFIFRAFGAGAWLSYSAPLALASSFSYSAPLALALLIHLSKITFKLSA